MLLLEVRAVALIFVSLGLAAEMAPSDWLFSDDQKGVINSAKRLKSAETNIDQRKKTQRYRKR